MSSLADTSVDSRDPEVRFPESDEHRRVLTFRQLRRLVGDDVYFGEPDDLLNENGQLRDDVDQLVAASRDSDLRLDLLSRQARFHVERAMDGLPRKTRRLAKVHQASFERFDAQLRSRACGAAARAAFAALPAILHELCPATDLYDLATTYHCGPDGERHALPLQVVLHSATESPTMMLCAMVMLRPGLEHVVSLLDPLGADDGAVDVLLGELCHLLPTSDDDVPALLRSLTSRTRRHTRPHTQRSSVGVTSSPLDDALEVPAPSADPAEIVGDLLLRLLEAGVLSDAEAELLVRTHVLGENLKDIADEVGVPYKTLQGQRWRCEQRCAGFLTREGRAHE